MTDLTAVKIANLRKANEVRTRKSHLKRDLAMVGQAEACRLVADRLVNDPSSIRAFTVEELLLSIEGIGTVKARKMAQSADWVPLTDRVGKLTERRCGLLARSLRSRADEVEQRVQAV